MAPTKKKAKKTAAAPATLTAPVGSGSAGKACEPLEPKTSDHVLLATQVLLDVPLRCEAMTRVLALVMQQNSDGVMLVDFGKHPNTNNVVLRFAAT